MRIKNNKDNYLKWGRDLVPLSLITISPEYLGIGLH